MKILPTALPPAFIPNLAKRRRESLPVIPNPSAMTPAKTSPIGAIQTMTPNTSCVDVQRPHQCPATLSTSSAPPSTGGGHDLRTSPRPCSTDPPFICPPPSPHLLSTEPPSPCLLPTSTSISSEACRSQNSISLPPISSHHSGLNSTRLQGTSPLTMLNIPL